jgi:cephalosporin-C deacetylase-like acetyl esterase
MGQGERLQYYEKEVGKSVIGPGVLEHEYAGTQCYPLGDSLATYFVFDAMRAIDYLCSRAEVDPARIGVTGNSGGGMQASMVMMSDPRIAAAAPATFITSRRAFLYADRAQDAEQIWPGFSALSFDHEDILLAIAPKPLLVLSAEYDFFPIEGTRSTVERVRRFWDAFGAGESLRLFTDKAVHAYTPRMAVEAATFFAEHLRGEKLQNFSPTIEVLEPSRLCSATDGQILADPSINSRACTIHDEIHHKALRLEQNRKTLPKGETEQLALSWLRNVVHKDRRGCELNPRLYMLDAQMEELSVYNAMWRAQPDLFNHAMIFRDTRRITERLPITIAVWDGGTRRLQPHWAWLREACAAGRSVMVLDVSGSGVLMPHSFHNKDPLSVFEVIHKLTVDLFWLGDSMAALRIFDVLRALDMAAVLPMTDSEDIQLYGSGRQGLYARLASHLDGRVSHMDWENPLPSVSSLVKAKYYDSQNLVSLLIPGMLQLFDLPELEAAAGTKQHDGTMR